jgi:hypothetical protein
MTGIVSGWIVAHAKLMPIVGAALVWFFFSGSRSILRTGRERFVRELLLCLACFGILFALLCFTSYGLVDPANGFARPGAIPVSPSALARFALMGWTALAVAGGAGVLLEWRIRRG